MDYQKGIDLIRLAAPEILADDIQFVREFFFVYKFFKIKITLLTCLLTRKWFLTKIMSVSLS